MKRKFMQIVTVCALIASQIVTPAVVYGTSEEQLKQEEVKVNEATSENKSADNVISEEEDKKTENKETEIPVVPNIKLQKQVVNVNEWIQLDGSGQYELEFTTPSDGKVSFYDPFEMEMDIVLTDTDGNVIVDKDYPRYSYPSIGLKKGSYKLNLKFSDSKFRIGFNKTSTIEQEFNDTVQSAQFINIGTKYTGDYNKRRSGEDIDYYKFNVEEKSTLEFTMSKEYDNATKYELYHVDDLENPVGYADPYYNSVGIFSNIEAGAYVLKVYKESNENISESNKYSFTLRAIPSKDVKLNIKMQVEVDNSSNHKFVLNVDLPEDGYIDFNLENEDYLNYEGTRFKGRTANSE